MNETTRRLARCFAAVFPKLNPDNRMFASPETVAEWDSTATITLINVIREEFGIEIDLDQAESLLSFAQLREYLETYSRTA